MSGKWVLLPMNLKVSLYSSVNDAPGVELTSGTVAGTNLGTGYAWVNVPVTTFDFTGYDSYFIVLPGLVVWM